MSSDALEQLMPEILALDPRLLTRPSEPSEDLHKYALLLVARARSAEFAPALSAIPVTPAMLERIELAAAALAEAQAAWLAADASSGSANSRLEDDAAAALKRLAAHLKYQCIERPEVGAALQGLSRNDSSSTVIFGLQLVRALTIDNRDAFSPDAGTSADAIVAEADSWTAKLSEAAARAPTVGASANARRVRDGAFLLARRGVDRLRAAGQLAFHDDRQRREAFLRRP